MDTPKLINNNYQLEINNYKLEETGIERYYREQKSQKERDWKLALSNPAYRINNEQAN